MAFIGVESVFLGFLYNYFNGGFYDVIMQRGATKPTYFVAQYFLMVLSYIIAALIFLLTFNLAIGV